MMIEVRTSRFGTIQVPEERILFFPRGLIGFEHLKRYARIDSQKGREIQWLQAVDDPEVAFLISDARAYLPAFELKLPEGVVSEPLARTADLKKLEILTILHVDRPKGQLHVHVQAPLLIDPVSRTAVQVITDAERPTVAIPLKAS